MVQSDALYGWEILRGRDSKKNSNFMFLDLGLAKKALNLTILRPKPGIWAKTINKTFVNFIICINCSININGANCGSDLMIYKVLLVKCIWIHIPYN